MKSMLYSAKISLVLDYPIPDSISRVSNIYPRADNLPLESTNEFQEVHESLKWYRNAPCVCLLAFILEK